MTLNKWFKWFFGSTFFLSGKVYKYIYLLKGCMATISFVVLGYKAKITIPPPKKKVYQWNKCKKVRYAIDLQLIPTGYFYLVILIRLEYSFHTVVFFCFFFLMKTLYNMHDDDIELSLINIKVNLIIRPWGVWFFFLWSW